METFPASDPPSTNMGDGDNPKLHEQHEADATLDKRVTREHHGRQHGDVADRGDHVLHEHERTRAS